MFKRTSILAVTIVCSLYVSIVSGVTHASESLAVQWKNGLAGAKLTSYSGSVISSNSTLTVVSFCRNGRYTYSREGSWSVPGSAAGASNSRIKGQWEIQQDGNQVFLRYMTDDGQSGMLPIYLQNDGKVNIYGTAFAVQRGGAGC